MLPTTLGVAAATWAVLMALSALLQVREIVRRGSSDGISVGYFAVLLVGFALWFSYGLARSDLPWSSRTPSPSWSPPRRSA
jgi:MtN3 and saliva related transmembrane protein